MAPVDKDQLRRVFRARLKTIPQAARAAAAEAICSRLVVQDFWIEAKTILFYAPLPGELDVWPWVAMALRQGKSVALPRMEATTGTYQAAMVKSPDQDLVSGKWGVREPATHCATVPLAQLELALIPGIAFDLKGGRLGRGKGFYDRLLAGFSGFKCGIAFDEQLAPELALEPHDIRMNAVLTATQTQIIGK